MKGPKKNLAESILARAELYRRGMMFDGVPSFATAELELPAAAAPDAGAQLPAESDPVNGQQAAGPAPGATAPLVAGAVDGKSPLQSMLGTP